MDCGAELPFRESWVTRADGMGRVRLSIRNPGNTLVLDWRHPGNAFPEHRDDAVLLYFEDALGSGLPEAPVRGIQPRSVGDLVCIHDRFDERHQHVFHGAGHEGCARLEYQLQHLGVVTHSGGLCGAGRLALGDF